MILFTAIVVVDIYTFGYQFKEHMNQEAFT